MTLPSIILNTSVGSHLTVIYKGLFAGVQTNKTRCFADAAQLPLVAVEKHAHQRLPVSLIRISPGGTVATASHEGAIHHHQFTQPDSPDALDSRLRIIHGKGQPLHAGNTTTEQCQVTTLPGAQFHIRQLDMQQSARCKSREIALLAPLCCCSLNALRIGAASL